MNVDAIREYCLSFPRTTESLQWGDNLCFKVAGKIFAILSLDDPRLAFKCTPETFAELIERQDIHRAPYVGRYNWVMLDHLNALPNEELRDFIRQSYEMVEANAPKKSGIAKSKTKQARPKRKKRSPNS